MRRWRRPMSAVAATLDRGGAGQLAGGRSSAAQDEVLTALGDVGAGLARRPPGGGRHLGAVAASWWRLPRSCAEDRWRYRTEEEAAGTWEIEVSDDLGAVTDASAALGAAVDARDDAATAVAAADERAAEVFADRPSEQPTEQSSTAP